MMTKEKLSFKIWMQHNTYFTKKKPNGNLTKSIICCYYQIERKKIVGKRGEKDKLIEKQILCQQIL